MMMPDRRNNPVKKVLVTLIAGIIGWFGFTVWTTAVKVAVLEAGQASFRDTLIEIRTSVQRIEDQINQRKGKS